MYVELILIPLQKKPSSYGHTLIKMNDVLLKHLTAIAEGCFLVDVDIHLCTNHRFQSLEVANQNLLSWVAHCNWITIDQLSDIIDSFTSTEKTDTQIVFTYQFYLIKQIWMIICIAPCLEPWRVNLQAANISHEVISKRNRLGVVLLSLWNYCKYKWQEQKGIQMKAVVAAEALTGLQQALGYISNPLQVSSSWSDGRADLKWVTWRLYQSNFEATDFSFYYLSQSTP